MDLGSLLFLSKGIFSNKEIKSKGNRKKNINRKGNVDVFLERQKADEYGARTELKVGTVEPQGLPEALGWGRHTGQERTE